MITCDGGNGTGGCEEMAMVGGGAGGEERFNCHNKGCGEMDVDGAVVMTAVQWRELKKRWWL